MREGLIVLTLALPLLAGCVVPPTPQTPVEQKLQVDPVTGRGFYLYVPSGYRHDKPAPLIISCHGTPPFDVAGHHIQEWKYYGEKYGCIVAAPALIATDGLLGDGPIVGMLEDERYILSLVSLLSYRYNIDRANVMITGFSGGGFPTYWVGLRHPDVFSVVVARNCNFSRRNIDGWFPDEARRSAVMVYFGQNDPGAIKGQSRQAIRYLRSKGFDVTVATIPGSGHDRHPEVAMKFFREHWRTPRATFIQNRQPSGQQ